MLLVVKGEALPYAGKTYQPGETFTASDEDGRLLKLIDRAASAPKNPPGPVGEISTLTASDVQADAPKRAYRTRRLKAEA